MPHAVYGPFAQHVKQFADVFASDDLPTGRSKLRAAIAGLVAPEALDQLASHLELLIGLRDEGDVADRQILFLAARQFVEALAREGPVVLLFEDLHWADGGTFDLLEVLASRGKDILEIPNRFR